MAIASNWWVERCLYGKCLVNPAQDVLSQPFGKLSVRGTFDFADSSYFGSTDVGRVLAVDCQFDRLFRHRIASCDKDYRAVRYGNLAALP